MLKARIITSAYQLVADLIGEYLDDCNEGDIHRVEVDGLRQIQSHMEKRALRKSVLWHDPDAPRILPPERGSTEARRQRMLERREKIRVEREQARAKQARHAPKKYADAPKLVHPAEVYRKKKAERQASQARKAAYLQRGLSKPNPNALSDHARESFRKAQEARGNLAPEKPLDGAWSDPNSPPW